MDRRRALVALPLLGMLASLGVSPVAAQAAEITVTGHEYAFGDLPTSVPAGTSLAFMNTGQEAHELILARKNDGVTESWDEIIALPEEEAFSKVTVLGPLFANPGEAAAFGIGPSGPEPMTALTVEQEGEWIALCFIPQGTTELPDFTAEAPASSAMPASSGAAGSAPPQGPPHFLLGMRQEFTVTAAGTEPGPVSSAAAAPAPSGSPAA
jgi:hypothetical protein